MSMAQDAECGIKRQQRFVVAPAGPDHPLWLCQIVDRMKGDRDATCDIHALALQRGRIAEGQLFWCPWGEQFLDKYDAATLANWANALPARKSRPV